MKNESFFLKKATFRKGARNERYVASILAIVGKQFCQKNSVCLVQVRTKIFAGRRVSSFSWL